MADFDLVIRGGTVFDGSGDPGREADVAVRDGRIAAVGKVPGRGAYLCHASGCWESALGSMTLQHALRTELSDAEQARLEAYANQLAVLPRASVENRP